MMEMKYREHVDADVVAWQVQKARTLLREVQDCFESNRENPGTHEIVNVMGRYMDIAAKLDAVNDALNNIDVEVLEVA